MSRPWAFSSSVRRSLWLLCSGGTLPTPSDPTISIVVLALTSSAVAPPRRATPARASAREGGPHLRHARRRRCDVDDSRLHGGRVGHGGDSRGRLLRRGGS